MNRRRPTETENHRGAYGPLAAVIVFIAVSWVAALVMGGVL